MAGYQTEVMSDKFFKLSEPDEKGYKYYIIPVGTHLYRGDTQMYIDYGDSINIKLPEKPLYFAKEFGVAEKYGIVYEFEVKKEYRLLAIDDEETIKNLYNNLSGNERMRNILRNNYGYESRKRSTEMTYDLKFAGYLCDNGYSGYGANQMLSGNDDSGNPVYIHRELMICNTDGVVPTKIYSDREDVDNLIRSHKERTIATELRELRTSKKTARKQHKEEESPFKRPVLLFGDDSNYSPPANKTLFGFDSPNSPPVNNNLFGFDSPPPSTPPTNRSLFNFDSPPPKSENKVNKRLSFAGKRKTKKVSKKKTRKTMKGKKRGTRKH